MIFCLLNEHCFHRVGIGVMLVIFSVMVLMDIEILSCCKPKNLFDFQLVVVCSSTQSGLIATQLLCVAWIHCSSANFRCGVFLFCNPQERLKKTFWVGYVLGSGFFWVFHSVAALFVHRFAS